VTAASLEKEVTYVFNYPHISTPCFLIRTPSPAGKNVKLKSEDGSEYVWSGAVGKNNDVVAYSAICAHALTHPNPTDSFMKYVPLSGQTMAYPKGGMIVCSAHMSVYDQLNGANNLAGEAKQPLACIILEEGSDGTLYAVGVLGPDMFQAFFKGFKPELKEQFGSPSAAKVLVSIDTKTVVLQEYTKEIIAY
jgi:arsenite oxidase small subunit